MSLRSSLCFGAALVILSGCGPSGPAFYEVAGTVTWNGAPLPQGDIIFESADGTATPSAGKVVDGTYKFKATAGKKLVRIMAMRDTGKFDPTMGTMIREMYLPERYNHESKLDADVKAEGDNRFNFTLTEK